MSSKIIEDIGRVIGEDNAAMLAYRFPGMGFYVPKDAENLPQFCALIGSLLTQKFCDHYSSTLVQFPMRSDIRKTRNKWIAQQHARGKTINELVAISGVSRRQIFNILRNQQQEVAA